MGSTCLLSNHNSIERPRSTVRFCERLWSPFSQAFLRLTLITARKRENEGITITSLFSLSLNCYQVDLGRVGYKETNSTPFLSLPLFKTDSDIRKSWSWAQLRFYQLIELKKLQFNGSIGERVASWKDFLVNACGEIIFIMEKRWGILKIGFQLIFGVGIEGFLQFSGLLQRRV